MTTILTFNGSQGGTASMDTMTMNPDVQILTFNGAAAVGAIAETIVTVSIEEGSQ